MARPVGSRNKRSRLGEAAIRALERRGEVSAPRVLVKLQQIAESTSPDRVAAAKVILAYTLGPPKQTVSLEVGPSPAQVLMEIARQRRKRTIDLKPEFPALAESPEPPERGAL